MSDEEVKAYAELAARNSKVAVQAVEKTRDELLTRIINQEQSVAMLTQQVQTLTQRINVMQYGQVLGATSGD